MAQNRWKPITLGMGAIGAAAGIWAALRWGNQYLDHFEDTATEAGAQGAFVTTSEGWRMHYTVQGAGSPVVMIHGFMDSLHTWRRNVQELARTHAVYAVDVIGFGSSDRVQAPIYTLKQQAHVLKEFFDDLNIGPADVVGHSMGGALACQFAYDFPDLVHKLILVAPATYLYQDLPFHHLGPVPRRFSRGVMGLYEKFQGDRSNPVYYAYGDPTRITPDAVDVRNQYMHVRGTHDALISMSKSKREADVPEKLNEVQVPTLIIWGRRDRVLPSAHAGRHYQAMPNVRLEWIESAGHLPHEEQPAAVNELLKQFLEE